MPRRPLGSWMHRWHQRTKNFPFLSKIPGKWLRAAGRLAEEVCCRWARSRGVRAHPSLFLLEPKYIDRFNQEADRATSLVETFGRRAVEDALRRTGRGRRLTSLLNQKALDLVREQRDRQRSLEEAQAKADAEAKAQARAEKFTPLPPYGAPRPPSSCASPTGRP